MLNNAAILTNITKLGGVSNYLKAIELEDFVYEKWGARIVINDKSTFRALMTSIGEKMGENTGGR